LRALLDTHTFLWWGADDPKLSTRAREILADDRNELLFSAVSGWEIAIKAALGKLDNVPEDLNGFIGEQISENTFTVLPIHLEHVLGVHALPQHHRDPFDRLLIVQALAEDIPLLSRDPQFAPYSVNVVWLRTTPERDE